jgi:hypothetical protein
MAVEQFGHMIWWGDPQVTQEIQAQIERHLQRCFTEKVDPLPPLDRVVR